MEAGDHEGGRSVGALTRNAMSRTELQVPQIGCAFGRHAIRHCLVQAPEHDVGQHMADRRSRDHGAGVRRIDDRVVGRGHLDGVERAGIVRDFRRDDAFDAEGRIGLGVAHRTVDAEIRGAGGALEIDEDFAVADCQRGAEVDGRVVAVDAHLAAPAAFRQRVDCLLHRGPAVPDDMGAQVIQCIEVILLHHPDEAAAPGLIARHQGVDIALDLHRLAHIGADQGEQPFIHRAGPRERHDRNEQSFVIDLFAVGGEPDAADVDDMAGAGEQGDHRPILERRRDDRQVVQVAGSLPRVVGDVDVAFLHAPGRKHVEEMDDRPGHGIDVSRRTGHRLGQHLSFEVEHAGGNVARLAGRGAERGPDQRLRLFLDDGQQPRPHDLVADVAHAILGHCVGSCLVRTICPSVLIVAVKPSVTSVDVSSSTITDGPAMVAPGCRSSRG